MPFKINAESAPYAPGAALISGELLKEDVAELAEGGISHVVLNGAYGWNGRGLANANGLASLRRLDILPYTDTDISDISEFTKLKHLHIGGNVKGSLNFESLSSLELFSSGATGGKIKLKEIGKSSSLMFIKGSFGERMLTEIAAIKNLRQLALFSSRFDSLNWLNGARELESLCLNRCTALVSLDGIEQAKKLSLLKLLTCKKLSGIAPLEKLKSLEYLMFDDCGEIESLKPLVGHKNLKLLSFIDTKIADCMISVIDEIPNLKFVRFLDRLGYDRAASSFTASEQYINSVFRNVMVS